MQTLPIPLKNEFELKKKPKYQDKVFQLLPNLLPKVESLLAVWFCVIQEKNVYKYTNVKEHFLMKIDFYIKFQWSER